MNVDELRPTWATRELPILRAALRHADVSDQPISIPELQAEVGLDDTQMRVALRALDDAGYLEVGFTGGGGCNGQVWGVDERARRELGTWPSADNLVAELAAALREASEVSSEPEQSGKLRAAADALTGFARDVAVAVVARHVGG
jgi:predicted ArsR family transcriptional regulator